MGHSELIPYFWYFYYILMALLFLFSFNPTNPIWYRKDKRCNCLENEQHCSLPGKVLYCSSIRKKTRCGFKSRRGSQLCSKQTLIHKLTFSFSVALWRTFISNKFHNTAKSTNGLILTSFIWPTHQSQTVVLTFIPLKMASVICFESIAG